MAAERKLPRLAGGVDSVLAGDPWFAVVADIGRLRGPAVATIAVDRGLTSGALDRVPMSEAKLAQLVADGAAILARLAAGRSESAGRRR